MVLKVDSEHDLGRLTTNGNESEFAPGEQDPRKLFIVGKGNIPTGKT